MVIRVAGASAAIGRVPLAKLQSERPITPLTGCVKMLPGRSSLNQRHEVPPQLRSCPTVPLESSTTTKLGRIVNIVDIKRRVGASTICSGPPPTEGYAVTKPVPVSTSLDCVILPLLLTRKLTVVRFHYVMGAVTVATRFNQLLESRSTT